jgi:hypothetical protein
MGAETAGNERYFTIGHSSRSVAQMAELLREAGADCIVDVRSIPRSRTNPQFNADVFPASLAAEGLDYYRIAELGGLRKRPKSGDPSPNAYWANLSFRNSASDPPGWIWRRPMPFRVHQIRLLAYPASVRHVHRRHRHAFRPRPRSLPSAPAGSRLPGVLLWCAP